MRAATIMGSGQSGASARKGAAAESNRGKTIQSPVIPTPPAVDTFSWRNIRKTHNLNFHLQDQNLLRHPKLPTVGNEILPGPGLRLLDKLGFLGLLLGDLRLRKSGIFFSIVHTPFIC